ncbi:MAG: hypothetical protein RR346_08775, partial [Bacteroidales bacterium]
ETEAMTRYIRALQILFYASGVNGMIGGQTGDILCEEDSEVTEEKLAYMFGIRSIPSLLFIPLEGGPTMEHGAKTKQQLEEYIKKLLDVNPPKEPKKIEE